MPTLTSRFEFIKPLVNDATDEDLWGGFLNDNFDMLDETVGRVLITTDDTAVGFAQDKIVAGQGAATEVGNPAANETLIIHTTGVPVGGYQFVDTSLVGAEEPSNAGTLKWVKLTEGLSGVGGFNEGLIGDEDEYEFEDAAGNTVTVYDAEILVGAMAGQRIKLINSMKAFVRPSDASGVVQGDAIRNIIGNFGNVRASTRVSGGAFRHTNVSSVGTGGAEGMALTFDASRVVPTAEDNRPINVGATAYMRIA